MSSTRRNAVVHAAALAVLATLAWACGPATSSGPGPVSPEAAAEAMTGSSPAEDAACVPFVEGRLGEPRDLLVGWPERGRAGGPGEPAGVDFTLWVRAEDLFHISAVCQDGGPTPALTLADGACELARDAPSGSALTTVEARLGPGVYTVRVELPAGESSARSFDLLSRADGPGGLSPSGACDTLAACCTVARGAMGPFEPVCETVEPLRAMDGGEAACLTALTGIALGALAHAEPLPDACRPAGP